MDKISKEQYLDMLNWDKKLWTILSKEEVEPLQKIPGHQNYLYSISPKGEKSFGKGSKVAKIEWVEKHMAKQEPAAVPPVPESIPAPPNKSDIEKVADASTNVEIVNIPKPNEDLNTGEFKLKFLQKNGLEYYEIDGTPAVISPDGHIITQGELNKIDSESWQKLTSTYSSFKVAKMKKEIEEAKAIENSEKDEEPVSSKTKETAVIELPESEKQWLEKNGWNPEKFLVLEKGDWEQLASEDGYELNVIDNVNDEEAIKLFGKDARIVAISFIQSLENKDEFAYKTTEEIDEEDESVQAMKDAEQEKVDKRAQEEADKKAEELAKIKAKEEAENEKKEKAVETAKKKQETESKAEQKAIDDGPRSGSEEKVRNDKLEKELQAFEAWKKEFIKETEADKKKIEEEFKAKEAELTSGNLGGLSQIIAELGFGDANLSLYPKGKGKFDSTLKVEFKDLNLKQFQILLDEVNKLNK